MDQNSISDYFKSFLKKNFAYTLSFIFERSIVFLLLPFYTKMLTPDNYGDYSVFIATVSIAVFFYSLGIENSLIKFKAELNDHTKLDSTIFSGMMGSSLIFTLILILFPANIGTFIFGSELYSDIILLLGITLLCDTIIRYFMFAVIGEQKSKLFLMISVAKGVLTIILNLVLVGYLQTALYGAVWAYLSTTGIVAITLIITKKVRLQFSFDKDLYIRLFKYSFPVMMTSAFIMMLSFADTYIFKYFFDAGEVGKYSASYKFGIGMNLFVTAYATAVIPFSLNLLKQNPEKKRVLSLVFRSFFYVMITIFAIVSLFYREIINININDFYVIDPKYHSSIDIIPVIVLAYIFMGIYTNAAVPFYYKGNTNKLALLTLIAVIFNLGLNIWLVPIYSYWGAALVTLFSFMILSTITYISAQRILKQKYNLTNMFITAILGIGLYLISYFYFPDNFGVKLLFLVSFIGVIIINFRKLKTEYFTN